MDLKPINAGTQGPLLYVHCFPRSAFVVLEMPYFRMCCSRTVDT